MAGIRRCLAATCKGVSPLEPSTAADAEVPWRSIDSSLSKSPDANAAMYAAELPFSAAMCPSTSRDAIALPQKLHLPMFRAQWILCIAIEAEGMGRSLQRMCDGAKIGS